VRKRSASVSKNAQNIRKLEQLREETIKAEETYDVACEQYGVESPQAEAAAEELEKVKPWLLKLTGEVRNFPWGCTARLVRRVATGRARRVWRIIQG
jgi:hypothetical protein